MSWRFAFIGEVRLTCLQRPSGSRTSVLVDPRPLRLTSVPVTLMPALATRRRPGFE